MYQIKYKDLELLKNALPNKVFKPIHEKTMEGCSSFDEWVKIAILDLTEDELKLLEKDSNILQIDKHEDTPIISLNEWAVESAPLVEGANGPGTFGNRLTVDYWNGSQIQHIRNGNFYRVVQGKVVHTTNEYLNINSLINEGYTGQGIKVGFIDDGYLNMPNNSQHADFSIVEDFNSSWQGTHSIMTIGVLKGKSDDYEGLATNCQVYHAYHTGNIGEQVSWLVSKGCQIINMSFYSSRGSLYTYETIRKAVSQGVIIVVAAGNNTILSGDNYQQLNPMATFPGVVAVEAMKGGEREDFILGREYRPTVNTYNKKTDFLVPVLIFTTAGITETYYNNEVNIHKPPLKKWYAVERGSSMSAAYLTGIFTLLLEKYPLMKGKAMINLLKLISKESFENLKIPKL